MNRTQERTAKERLTVKKWKPFMNPAEAARWKREGAAATKYKKTSVL